MGNLSKTSFIKETDDLGRIAIPKEILRKLAIKKGEQFEIFVTRDNEIVLKKNYRNSDASSQY